MELVQVFIDGVKAVESGSIKAGDDSERITLRKDIIDAIWKKAYSKTLDRFIFNEVIPHIEPAQYFPDGHPFAGKRKPRADIGPVYGEDWVRRLKNHKKLTNPTREKLIESENDASLYEIQERTFNRSHKGDMEQIIIPE